jgi:hypothetical protein
MKLFDILKQCGVFSSDIKNRIKNKQIIINGVAIDTNIDLDIETEIVVDNLSEVINAKIFETGGFICNILSKENANIFSKQMRIFGFENLFNSNVNNNLTEYLNQFILIRISKKESFIVKKCQN